MSFPFIIDVAISLILIFLVGSLLASEIQELITTVLQWRAKHLKESIESLLSGGLSTTNEDIVKDLVDRIYDDPLIKGINQEARGIARHVRRFGRWVLQCIDFKKIFGDNRTTGPSYMVADTFTMALTEQLGLTLLARKLVEVRLTNFSKRIIGLVKVKENISPINGNYVRNIDILPDQNEELNRLWNKGRVRLMGEKAGFFNLNEDPNFKTLADEFVDIVIDFKAGENDLQTSIRRMEESFTAYIDSVDGSTPEPSSEPHNLDGLQPNHSAFVKRLKNLRNNMFREQSDRVLASDLLRPSLVEFAELLDTTSQTYQEVRESFEELAKKGVGLDKEVNETVLKTLLETQDTALLEQQLILRHTSNISTTLEKLHPQPSQRYLPNILARQKKIDHLKEQLRQLFPDTSQFCCRIKVPAAARSQKAKAIATELRQAARQNRKDIETILRKLSEGERHTLIAEVVKSLDDSQLYSDLSGSEAKEPHLGLADCVLDHMPNDERHLLIYSAISQLSRAQHWASEYEAERRSLYDTYDTYKRIYIVLDQLPGAVKDSFLTLAKRAQNKVGKVEGNVEQFRTEMSAWFDQSMERSSGVYKRNAKLVSLLLGIAIAVSLNIDALYVTSRVSNDENLRQVVTEAAISLSEDEATSTAAQSGSDEVSDSASEQNPKALKDIRRKTDEALRDLVLPIGWNPQNLADQLGCSSNTTSNSLSSWDDFYIACGDLPVNNLLSLNLASFSLESTPLSREESLVKITDIPHISLKYSQPSKSETPLISPAKTGNWLTQNIRLGWNILLHHKAKSIRMAIGWLSAGLAISMGAPFWFDILNKLVNVRNTGSKPAATPNPSSDSSAKTS